MATKLSRLRILLKPKPNCKREYSNGLPENLRRNYEKFQREDGVPVYLKGGVTDRLLLGVTVTIIGYGLVDGLYTLTRLDRKQ